MNQNPSQSYLLITPTCAGLRNIKWNLGNSIHEVATLSSKHNAIISACNEIEQHGLPCLICSHCWHSGDGLPVRIHCVECFISKQWFNALWSTTSCASHTSSGVLLENTWGEKGWGLAPWDEVSLHCRNCADWAILIDRPCLYSELSEVQDLMWQQQCLPSGEKRPQQNKHSALVCWKSLRAGPVCQSPQVSLKQERWEVKWTVMKMLFWIKPYYYSCIVHIFHHT